MTLLNTYIVSVFRMWLYAYRYALNAFLRSVKTINVVM